MTTEAVIYGVVMLVVVGLLIALPYMQGRRRKIQIDDTDAASVEGLQTQLTQILDAIRDLDFDFDTGKIPEEDYVEQRKFLIGRGVSTLIRLDDALAYQDSVDEEIESLVNRFRQQNI